MNGSDIVNAFFGAGPLASRLTGAAGERLVGYDRKNKTQMQIGTLKPSRNVLGAEHVYLLGESGLSALAGIGDPATSPRYGRGCSYGAGRDGCPAVRLHRQANTDYCEDNGYRDIATHGATGAAPELSYPDVAFGANLKPRVFFSHDVKGYSADGMFVEDRRTVMRRRARSNSASATTSTSATRPTTTRPSTTPARSRLLRARARLQPLSIGSGDLVMNPNCFLHPFARRSPRWHWQCPSPSRADPRRTRPARQRADAARRRTRRQQGRRHSRLERRPAQTRRDSTRRKGYADPYAAEKPLYTITAANAQQHKDKLAPGQLELLKRYPSYKINVYPTHRSAAYPQRCLRRGQVRRREGCADRRRHWHRQCREVDGAVPVPKAGVEVLWNHMTRYRGGSMVRHQREFPVQNNGSFTPVTRTETIALPPRCRRPEPNRLLYYITTLTGPSSLAGESNLLHATLDQTREPNQVWAYNPGQRRVLRAPDLCCDTPEHRCRRPVDDRRLRRILRTDRPLRVEARRQARNDRCPYNNFKLADRKLKYSNIIKPAHIDPELVRYEPHRVWVVEATLKPGARHVYAKRIFYFDEDSWQMVHADQYDGRNELWRVHELHSMPYYDVPMMWYAADVVYDLQARRYIVFGLTNESKPIRFGINVDLADFSVDALRRAGR